MPESPGTETVRPWASPSAPAPSVPATISGAGSSATPGAKPNGALLRAPARRTFRQRPIPLRPMTVLELIDGAVAAVTSLPRFLLVRAALTTSVFGLAALALTWWFNRAVALQVQQHPMWTSLDFVDGYTTHFAPSVSEKFCLVVTEVLIAVVCSGFAATVVAGLFAPSVKAYVDAEPADAAALRALLKGRVLRLYLIALVVALPRMLCTALFGVLTWYAAVHPGSIMAGWCALVVLGIGIPCFLLTATTAVAAPAAALEDIKVRPALRRARRLAERGVLRVAWTCLLALFMVALATTALDVFNAQLRRTFGVGAQFAALPGSPGFSWWLLIYAVCYLLTLLVSTPFRSATAVLLYVDRRFRREGLDIRIAWARLAQHTPRRVGGGPAA